MPMSHKRNKKWIPLSSKINSQLKVVSLKISTIQSQRFNTNAKPIESPKNCSQSASFNQQYNRLMAATEICNAMLQFARQIKELRHYSSLSLESFSQGLPFAVILSSTQHYDLSFDDLDQKCSKWINKVGNLKKVLAKVRLFFQKIILKTEKIDEIDIVQIAKHNSHENLARFFEVIMTVLLNSARKDYYIQCIMNLDQHFQKTFVQIIKNSTQQEHSLSPENSLLVELQEEIKELRRENAQLKSSVSELTRKNKLTQKQLKDLRDKLISYEEEMELKKANDHSQYSDDLQSQNDKQRVMIDNLKIKVLTTVRESEMEISQLRQEISVMKLKCDNIEDLQSTLEHYKDLYNQAVSELQKMNQLEKEKRRLAKALQEKDYQLKLLQVKFQGKDRVSIKLEDQQHLIKENKFKNLEKEIKRLKSEPAEISTKTIDSCAIIEDQKDEIKYMQEELARAKLKVKEHEKQSIKSRKKLDKLNDLEKQRKRLERVINQINKCKDSQIELLLVSLNQLREENIKLFAMLKSSQFSKLKK